jgi:PKHD-type hydroxylase
MEALIEMPVIRNHITHPYVISDNLIDLSILDAIEKYCSQQGTNPATIGNRDQNKDIRISETKFHFINDANGWIFDILEYVANIINDKNFQFDLIGFDRFQYTVYNQIGSHYAYHTDMAFGLSSAVELRNPRKLSFSLVLSDNTDYTGGDFEIITDNVDAPIIIPQEKGRIISFPSYIHHRVTPLTSGVRKSIVFWAVGPKFK